MKDYKKILEDVVNIINTTENSDIGFVNICDYIGENCPELKEKESEDEMVRKAQLDYWRSVDGKEWYGVPVQEVIAWLEKQSEQTNLPEFTLDDVLALQCCIEIVKEVQEDKDLYEKLNDIHGRVYDAYQIEKQSNIDKASYEIAEKEKYDFVSGQFIECRKSFNEFKEYNSYWLEYIGNDTYIGRSDNILNQKFHITPRQLYRLFTQEHYYYSKENNINEETNAPTAYGKYVDECLNKAAKHFFSEGEDEYTVADLFYAGMRCGQSWLEKQGQTFTKKDVDDAYLKGVCDAKQELEKQGKQKLIFNADDWYISKVDGKIHNIYNVGVEPKFKIGDWVVDKSGLAQQILDFRGGVYTCTYNNFITDCESNYHLWSIQDAKDGDVLLSSDGSIFIFKEVVDLSCKHYIALEVEDGTIQVNDNFEHCWESVNGVCPATREQRDLLFQKMRETGYEWDEENRELKKIEQKDSTEEISGNLRGISPNSKWTEEDNKNFNSIDIALFEDKNMPKEKYWEIINWLRSIKKRLEE